MTRVRLRCATLLAFGAMVSAGLPRPAAAGPRAARFEPVLLIPSAPNVSAPALAAQAPSAAASAAPFLRIEASGPSFAAPQAAGADAPAASLDPSAPGESAAADAGRLFDDADVRGRTLLVVGTRSSRGFILEETVRVSQELGLGLLLLDRPERRPDSAAVVPETSFLPAQVDRRDAGSIAKVVAQVVAFAKRAPIHAVTSLRSQYARLSGALVDALGAVGIARKAVLTADDKVLTREALNADPSLRVPLRLVESAEQARRAFRELGGGRFVMKSVFGQDSRFVELGIDSEEGMARAYVTMEAALKAYAARAESEGTVFSEYPGILVERMLVKAPGTAESSVDLVAQRGKPAFALVSDTHGIGPDERYAGGSMTFPSQQPPSVQRAMIEAAAKAVDIVGIKDGVARVDVIMTAEGPRVIEVNPHMAGAGIWRAVKLVTGVSLVEHTIRALFGLRLPAGAPAAGVVDYRFAASPVDGVLLSVTGLDEARAMPGVRHVQQLAEAGDRLSAPIENGFEEWLEVIGEGRTAEEARANSVKALARIKFRVRRDDGSVVEHAADYLQPKP